MGLWNWPGQVHYYRSPLCLSIPFYLPVILWKMSCEDRYAMLFLLAALIASMTYRAVAGTVLRHASQLRVPIAFHTSIRKIYKALLPVEMPVHILG